MKNKIDALFTRETKKFNLNRRSLIIHGGNILFLLPALAFFLFVVLIPFIQGLPYSFTNWKSIMSTKRDYVGFRNYALLLTNKYFLTACGNTLKFTIIYILSTNVLALAVAMLLQYDTKVNRGIRTVFLMPFCVSAGAGAIMWRYLFTDAYSKIFHTISPLGLASTVMRGIIVIAAWRDMGYCMLIYIAALQTIPSDFYDAAIVAGANKFQQFFKITLPLIIPAFTSNVTLLLAWGIKLFDLPMAVARNNEGAQTVAMYVYDYIFSYSKAGIGQAAAVIVIVSLLILTRIVTAIFRRMEVEV